MRDLHLSEVEEATEYKSLPKGGYVCGITAVEDVQMNANTGKGDYLKMEYDIAEGEFKNYYRALYENKDFWGGKFIKSYKETALAYFKAFITSVENSNSGYKFNNDEKTLMRKLVGLVLGEEEYQANDGTIKTRLYVAEVHSADRIRKGDFKVPELKQLKSTATKASTPAYKAPVNNDFEEIVSDDDLPF